MDQGLLYCDTITSPAGTDSDADFPQKTSKLAEFLYLAFQLGAACIRGRLVLAGGLCSNFIAVSEASRGQPLIEGRLY